MKTENFEKSCSEIKSQGYTIIRNFIKKDDIGLLLKDTRSFELNKMRSTTGNEIIDSKLTLTPHKNSINFCNVIFDETIEKFCKYFLNDMYYRSIPQNLPNYSLNMSIVRSSGKDLLTFHRDDRNPPSDSKEVTNLQFALALEKSDENNGCTVCVPGSHLFDYYVKDIEKYNKYNFVLKPGDLMIYDGRLWHSASPNYSDRTRWKFFFGYSRWHIKQTYDYTKNINTEILKNLKLNQKLILGFHAITKVIDNDTDGAGQRGNLDYAEKKYLQELNSREI
jgi:ectoine hydroxylase-related dioxygenase (phytanoyl-CoA dioxygenase family)